MKIENVADLRDMLEQMETQQLDEMLLEELRKESPNGELIRLIGSVLKERDRDMIPEIDANIQQAWERYQRKSQPVHKKPKCMNTWLLKAASLILVLLALFTLLPQEAKAMSFFERFVEWTENVFSLISPSEAKNREAEYVFQTDNPGLQEVYDRVTELGVTVPVVPMWLPEGYELVEMKVNNTPTNICLSSKFLKEASKVIYQLNMYSDNVTSTYPKDDNNIYEIEKNGTVYRLMNNKDLLVAVWSIENIECSIFVDCQEGTLIRILESIYMVEEN